MLRITQRGSAQGAVKYFEVAWRSSDYYMAEHGVGSFRVEVLKQGGKIVGWKFKVVDNRPTIFPAR